MLVFYNSLVEKSNCWNTAAFYSCFFFSLLPPWFESGVALGNQFGSRWLLCELNRLGLLAKINPHKVFNFTFCQVLILLIRTGWCQLKSRDVEEIAKLVGPVLCFILLFFYAWTGCDTCSAPHGMGGWL